MPALLEAKLVISGKDESGGAIESVRKHIAELDKSVATLDKLMTSTAKVSKATDPMAASISEAQRAIMAQKEALAGLTAGLDRFAGASGAVASAESRLRSEIERTNSALANRGREQRSQAEHGGLRNTVHELAPWAGPGILEATKGAVDSGATVQERIAQLQSVGATQAEIDKARAQFRDFSRTHAGSLESDYLASYKDARVIAPAEAYEMTELGARYRTSLRNSGISSSEYDVGNVMRIMDELGLKDMGQREGFLDNFLKSQQAFGDQIKTETALSAYRNAKQSIYGWSPEFRDKFFPTLLQSSGQQGGTEMMTALNNYIGGHMQQTELKALIAGGFVSNKDLIFDHNKAQLRPGAHLFEADVFKQNIAQWAWDFHDHFMARKGSTESGFDDLIAKMPRNMAGLIAFLVHNEARVKRDAETLEKPVGLRAESNRALGDNPVAGLAALRDALSQFAAVVTTPAMVAAGHRLESLSQAIQSAASAYGDFAKSNPGAAKSIAQGSILTGLATGGWLTMKLLGGLSSKFFGSGGGTEVASGAAAAAGAAGGGGWLSRLGMLGRLAGSDVLMPILALRELGELMNPTTAAGAPYRNDIAWPNQVADIERARRAQAGLHQGADMEAARGKALGELGKALVEVIIKVDEGSLLKVIASAVAHATGNLEATVGRMDGNAAPVARGIGRM